MNNIENINNIEFRYEDFLEYLIQGNKNGSSKLIKNYVSQGMKIKDIYEVIIRKSLYRVGELWEQNKVSVATEHMATAITESILNELFEFNISDARTGNKIIAACVENESHQVGIKMVADIFESNGWDSYFMGANTPTTELIDFAKVVNPDVIALSLSIYFNLPVLKRMIIEIRRQLPNIIIIVGGQAFNRIPFDLDKTYKKIHFLPDLYSIEQFIANWQSQK